MFDSNNKAELRGFTLIELLVVIAIIALLAAILFPVFASAREKARQTTCASNEQQLGLAFMQYSEDYDERLPCGALTDSYQGGNGWAGEMYNYLKSKNIFQCPDDMTPFAGPGGSTYVTYVYNLDLQFTNVPDGFPGPAGNLSKLTAPSKTVMLSEGRDAYATIWPIAGDDISGGQDPYSPSACGDWNAFGWSTLLLMTGPMGGRAADAASYIDPSSLGRHTNGSNFLLCDGHVKWFKGSSVSSGLNATASTNAEGAGDDRSTAMAAGTANAAYAITFSGT